MILGFLISHHGYLVRKVCVCNAVQCQAMQSMYINKQQQWNFFCSHVNLLSLLWEQIFHHPYMNSHATSDGDIEEDLCPPVSFLRAVPRLEEGKRCISNTLIFLKRKKRNRAWEVHCFLLPKLRVQLLLGEMLGKCSSSPSQAMLDWGKSGQHQIWRRKFGPSLCHSVAMGLVLNGTGSLDLQRGCREVSLDLPPPSSILLDAW